MSKGKKVIFRHGGINILTVSTFDSMMQKFEELFEFEPGETEGYSVAEIEIAEERLGFTLPELFKEFYRKFAKSRILNKVNDFVPISKLSIEEGGRLDFYHEEQGAWFYYLDVEEVKRGELKIHIGCFNASGFLEGGTLLFEEFLLMSGICNYRFLFPYVMTTSGVTVEDERIINSVFGSAKVVIDFGDDLFSMIYWNDSNYAARISESNNHRVLTCFAKKSADFVTMKDLFPRKYWRVFPDFTHTRKRLSTVYENKKNLKQEDFDEGNLSKEESQRIRKFNLPF